jgi:hypothetical protein
MNPSPLARALTLTALLTAALLAIAPNALAQRDALLMGTYRQALSADLNELIECTRILVRERPAPPQGGPPRQSIIPATQQEREALADGYLLDEEDRRAYLSIDMNRLGFRNQTLRRMGLLFVTEAPVMACRPTGHNEWVAAQEVRFGTAPGRLTEVVPVNLSMEEAIESQPSRSGWPELALKAHPPWHALLPATTEAVFAQIVFEDGSTSREMRLPIDEVEIIP